MAVIKCKMCGGDLNFVEGATVVECEYCGSKQTIPNQDNEKKLTLFARAERLRRACEFDKAAGVYESIVADFPEEAEAYWGLVLCRYGIEYVDDPASGRKVPTCHRSSFDSILEDTDFDQACENSDVIARRLYREEAKAIEGIRRGIIEVSGREQPYDIFICYKETDESGNRTIDSVIAQDVFDALTEKGYRVFFSRISLEDKLGTEYEPYIFAALNSAKVMLAFGTDYEYFNAVWVKNEWSRFLALMAAGQKKILIPCYKGIDAYDMPKEFQRLQSQDMGKVGAVQDLLRGIGKIIGKDTAPVGTASVPAAPTAPGVESLLKRGNMSLEDKNWTKANELFDQVLSIDPECAEAYLGMAMANEAHPTRDAFAAAYIAGEVNMADRNLLRAKQFGSSEQKAWLAGLEQERQKTEVERQRKEAEAEAKRRAEEAERQRQEAERQRKEAERQRKEAEAEAERQRKISLLAEKRRKLALATGLLAAGYAHTVGLRADGRAVAVGNNDNGQCDVGFWTDLVAVAADSDHTVGLRADGRAVVVGDYLYSQCDLGGWTDLMTVTEGSDHTLELQTDGTAVAETYYNGDGRCDLGGWTDLVAIVEGRDHTLGLRMDGTAVAVGKNDVGQCDVGGWTDLVAIVAGGEHTVGLRADGRAVAVGNNDNGQCDVGDWTDLVAVVAGDKHTVGLRADGTVVAVGNNEFGQCDVSGWNLFDRADTLEQERRSSLEAEKASLQTELANLKGLFSGGKRKEIESRLAEIDAELKKI